MPNSDRVAFILLVSKTPNEISLIEELIRELCPEKRFFLDCAQTEEEILTKLNDNVQYELVIISSKFTEAVSTKILSRIRATLAQAEILIIEDAFIVSALKVCDEVAAFHHEQVKRDAIREALSITFEKQALSSENRRLMAALRAKNIELSMMQQRLDDKAGKEQPDVARLLSAIRHRVNNPLTGVLGQAQLLLRRSDQLPEDIKHRIETIEQLTLRISEVFLNLDHSEMHARG